ncbi:MAG: gfo/Idh/MocA family oxidoreductase, partial [Candidatus Saccharibacteria bacterium]|nr:gfo/Idh/MocA family oxidoreductase [Microbacteriaceae bacterium]
SGTIETIIPKRPILESSSGLSGTGGAELGDVTVDDVALFTGRYDSGVLGIFGATRFATGRKKALRVEVSGSKGAIPFDLEDLNSLQFYDATADATLRGFTKILVTEPEHPFIASWWPAGHMLGYEHAFSHQVKDFVDALTSGTQPTPSFDDGLQLQRVLAAVESSSNNGSAWTPINHEPRSAS